VTLAEGRRVRSRKRQSSARRPEFAGEPPHGVRFHGIPRLLRSARSARRWSTTCEVRSLADPRENGAIRDRYVIRIAAADLPTSLWDEMVAVVGAWWKAREHRVRMRRQYVGTVTEVNLGTVT
jgi:hypothetical protein